ncbi:hypothetical protein F2P81_005330 [Scophthalmus maximus]|uniref:Uncharacterized protein n=1 Tax=Scophthalmus maximus TaxID=52904 RepID=A0A6A4TBN1_SCOMX|nr:hypothetical protein F2P81_005330 [Scophthalmus maximus]
MDTSFIMKFIGTEINYSHRFRKGHLGKKTKTVQSLLIIVNLADCALSVYSAVVSGADSVFLCWIIHLHTIHVDLLVLVLVLVLVQVRVQVQVYNPALRDIRPSAERCDLLTVFLMPTLTCGETRERCGREGSATGIKRRHREHLIRKTQPPLVRVSVSETRGRRNQGPPPLLFVYRVTLSDLSLCVCFFDVQLTSEDYTGMHFPPLVLMKTESIFAVHAVTFDTDRSASSGFRTIAAPVSFYQRDQTISVALVSNFQSELQLQQKLVVKSQQTPMSKRNYRNAYLYLQKIYLLVQFVTEQSEPVESADKHHNPSPGHHSLSVSGTRCDAFFPRHRLTRDFRMCSRSRTDRTDKYLEVMSGLGAS